MEKWFSSDEEPFKITDNFFVIVATKTMDNKRRH